MPDGRLLIGTSDVPLEPAPAWERFDDTPNLVAGCDITSGRQTLVSQTETGHATVFLNDQSGRWDPRNSSSDLFDALDGRQIMYQLYEPYGGTWEPQFRGWIDDITYDLDGSGIGPDKNPVNANIQISCSDVFDFLGGYGLTPGLDGITPRSVPSGTAGGAVPAGLEAVVYYAETSGTVDDRIIEVLADVGIDPSRYIVASGNVKLQAARYDPDESAMSVLRDCADSELPFIGNLYVDRSGRLVFRGRNSRFYPDDVAAEPGSEWDFTRWAVGDGQAILAEPDRGQMRILAYTRGRSNIINAVFAYPQGIAPADLPGQVYADNTSIGAYGKHAAAPMGNLLTLEGIRVAGPNTTANEETALFAELLVKNQKDPREAITALQVKAVRPDDDRAASTWPILARADISHIINVAGGYPGGVGFAGDSPADDYYIEGYQKRIRPLNPDHDYVEVDFEVSPAVWSMDTHGVFPAFSGGSSDVLEAEFAVAF